MCFINSATDIFRVSAILCNASTNSGSSEILVWWPVKDTDIFFIIFSPQPGNRTLHGMRHHIGVIYPRLYYPAY